MRRSFDQESGGAVVRTNSAQSLADHKSGGAVVRKFSANSLADLKLSPDAARTSLVGEMTGDQIAHLDKILKRTVVNHHKVTVKHDSPEELAAMLKRDRTQDLAQLVLPNGSSEYWIESGQATLVVAILICTNILLIGVQADLPAKESDFQNGTYVLWFSVDSFFNIVFLAEIILRLRAEGLAYWRQAANLFDVGLVTLSVIDTWVVLLLAKMEGPLQISKVFRTLRLLRVFRVLRLFRFCSTLWILINTMLRAFSALGWIMVLMVLFIYLVAVTMRLTLGVSMYEKLDGDELQVAEMRWGSVFKSMFTLFVCMTGEAWYDITLDAVAVEGWLYVVFVPFMCIASFLLVNLFIGIMCEKVSHEAEKEKELSAQRADEDTVHALAEIFVTIDKDGSDEITIEELSEALKCERLEHLFEALDIRMPTCVTSLMRFFDDDTHSGDGVIHFGEFVNGCMALRTTGLEVKIWFLQDELRQMSESLLANISRKDNVCRGGKTQPRADAIAEGDQNWMMEDVAQMLESRLREVKTGMMEDFTRILEAVVREATSAASHAAAKQEAGPNSLAGHATQGSANPPARGPDQPMAGHITELGAEPEAALRQQRSTGLQRGVSACEMTATPSIVAEEVKASKSRKAQNKVKKGMAKHVDKSVLPSTGAAEGAAQMESRPQITRTYAAEDAVPMELVPERTSTHAEGDAALMAPGPQTTSANAAEDVAKGAATVVMKVLSRGLTANDWEQPQIGTQQEDTGPDPIAAMADQVLTDQPAQNSDPPNAEQGVAKPASERHGFGESHCPDGDVYTGTDETGPLSPPDTALNFSAGPSGA